MPYLVHAERSLSWLMSSWAYLLILSDMKSPFSHPFYISVSPLALTSCPLLLFTTLPLGPPIVPACPWYGGSQVISQSRPEQAWGGVLTTELRPQPLSEQLDPVSWGIVSFSSWHPLEMHFEISRKYYLRTTCHFIFQMIISSAHDLRR